MRLQPAPIALVSGLLTATFACAAAQESLSKPESKGGSTPQFTTPQLPLPTGQFGVGRVGYQWTDGSRPDGHAADPNAHRDLMVYLLVPCAEGVGW
jgi:hypothetical protein